MTANPAIADDRPRLISAFALAGVVIAALVDLAWLLATPLRLNDSAFLFLANVALSIGVGLFLARYFQARVRIAILFGGLTFLLAAWPALRLFNHLTMTLAMPLADARLASWDSALGFDWFAYVHWVDRQPLLQTAMASAYTGLTAYSCGLFVLLALGRQPQQRCAEMIDLFVANALACTIIGLAFPALAAMAFYAPPAGTFESFRSTTGAYHLADLMALRSDPSHAFDLKNLPGLVTFPSFHTAMGIVGIYCARGTRWLFVPVLVVNLLMIAATPVFGSHYGVDILAGASVALTTILAHRLSAGWTIRLPSFAAPELATGPQAYSPNG